MISLSNINKRACKALNSFGKEKVLYSLFNKVIKGYIEEVVNTVVDGYEWEFPNDFGTLKIVKCITEKGDIEHPIFFGVTYRIVWTSQKMNEYYMEFTSKYIKKKMLEKLKSGFDYRGI